MRVQARHLRRDVGTHTHQATAELVGDLEGHEVEIVTGTRQQGIQVFHQGREHQLVAPGGKAVEQATAQGFQAGRLGREHIAHAIGQQPGSNGTGHETGLAGSGRTQKNRVVTRFGECYHEPYGHPTPKVLPMRTLSLSGGL